MRRCLDPQTSSSLSGCLAAMLKDAGLWGIGWRRPAVPNFAWEAHATRSMTAVTGQRQAEPSVTVQGRQELMGARNASSSGATSSPGHAGPRHTEEWDWAFVIGRKRGRKPAIKRPQRHQWHFCNPSYDASRPLPRRILPPHAPPTAADADDWQLFQARLGHTLPTDKARAEFVRYLKLRDVDWRDAFHRGLARFVADHKRQQRQEAERTRQRAWHEYRERVFLKALDQGIGQK